MKLKREIGFGLAVAAAIYCVLAYIFMWPPVVREFRPRDCYCIYNLRNIDEAIQQWASEHGKHTGDPVKMEDITVYIKRNKNGEIPECPSGGKYSVTTVGAAPTCSFGINSPIWKNCRGDMLIEKRHGYFYYEYITPGHHELP